MMVLRMVGLIIVFICLGVLTYGLYIDASNAEKGSKFLWRGFLGTAAGVFLVAISVAF